MNERLARGLFGLWLGTVAATAPAASGEVPVVRVVEVGDAGVVFADVAVRADVEVSTSAPFRGTLTVTHRWSGDPDWLRAVSWGDRVVLPLDLETGTTPLEVELPCPFRAASLTGPQPFFEVVWALDDARGGRLATGRRPARLEPVPVLRHLRLTAEPGDGFRRAPDRAWDLPARYEPYALVLASREDLRALRDSQRQALFDAVALGLTLVVTSAGGPDAFGPLGPPFDEVLAAERVSWRGSAGGEIRESPLLWGRLRRTTLDAKAPPKDTDDPALLPWMLLTAPRGRPDAVRTPRPDEGTGSSRLPERARAARLGVLVALSAVATVLVLLFLASGKGGRPARLPVALALAACLASPPILYVGLASERAGNTRWRFRVTVHDGHGPVACVGTYAADGGGGGSGPVTLPWESPRRGIHAAGSVRHGSLNVVPSGRRAFVVMPSSVDVAPDSLSYVFSRSLVRPVPLWEADVREEGGRLVGTLQARRAVRDAWLVGPRALEGRHVGAVPAGGRVDIAVLPPVRGRRELEAGLGALRRAFVGSAGTWFDEVPIAYWPAPDFPTALVVSEEEAARDGTAVYDCQGLPSVAAPDEVLVELPAARRKDGIDVWVPTSRPLADDASVLVSRYTRFDVRPVRVGRVEEASGGFRRAVVGSGGQALEDWTRLRPDLPKGTGYVALRSKGGPRG